MSKSNEAPYHGPRHDPVTHPTHHNVDPHKAGTDGLNGRHAPSAYHPSNTSRPAGK